VIKVGESGTWFRTTLPRYGERTQVEDTDDDADLGLLSILQLAEAVGPELVRSELVNAYVALLKDNEAEVRTAGAGQIPGTSFASYSFICIITTHRFGL